MRSLLSAFAIITAYLLTLVWALWGMDVPGALPHVWQLWPIPVLQWLGCGLFITAHDACHGTAAPHHPRLNLAIGRICAALYAGFWFDTLRCEHHLHHRHAGTAKDPDFTGAKQGAPNVWLWGARFAWHYTRWSQWVVMVGISQCLMHGLGIAPVRVIGFWALPAWLSAVQLFYFGTYLPHRPLAHVPFADKHRTRDSGFSWAASLLSCYHFGYHQVHHEQPGVAWFDLPKARRARSAEAAQKPHSLKSPSAPVTASDS